MAQKNRANMLTDIVSNIYNNLINFITGQNAQDRFVNLLDSSPNILSDASQPNGYVSTDANNEMFSSYYDEEISRADLISDLTANLAVGGKFYRINDAVGSTITLLVIAESNINLYSIGTDIATGEQGTYDITTDVFIPIVVSGTPDLQQVTDVGFITTNKLLSDDGAGNYTEIGNGEIKIATGNTGDVNIDSSLVTASYVAQLPDKPTSPQTFAMLSDITGGGLDLEVNGTPNVDQTLLNLIEGVNIDIADNGTGGVTITSLADRYKTSSVTSNTISNGAKTFTVDANLAYIPLQEVLIVYDPSNHMHATVTSYSGTTLVVDVKTHTGSGTYSSWVINLDGTPVDAITGVGTANEIAYFTAGQVIASLPVATYPSLTELSYVKGVTSAIQTQLNAIEKPISSVGNGTAVTGVIVNTYSKGLLIPANSRTANDVVQVDFQVTKTGAAGNVQLRFYWNTTNDLSGSPILLGTSPNGAALWLAFSRLLSIEVANGTGNATKVAPTSITTLATGYGTSTTTTSTVAIDWTANGYLICSILNSNAADSSVCHMLKLN
jgi:hypothetical protein